MCVFKYSNEEEKECLCKRGRKIIKLSASEKLEKSLWIKLECRVHFSGAKVKKVAAKFQSGAPGLTTLQKGCTDFSIASFLLNLTFHKFV